jgi:hypothetical protein
MYEDSRGSAYGPVAGSCGHDNEPSGSITGGGGGIFEWHEQKNGSYVIFSVRLLSLFGV